MSNIADKLNYLNDTKKAIKTAISNRGVVVSDDDTFRSYADKIDNIGETVEKTKYGVGIDSFLGDVDANGEYIPPSVPYELNLSGIKSVALGKTLSYKFSYTKVKKVIINDLVSVSSYSFSSAFSGCLSLEEALIESLEEISSGEGPFGSTFSSCTSLKTVKFSRLKKVSSLNAFQNCFSGCPVLRFDEVFPELEEIDGMSAFNNFVTYGRYATTTAVTPIRFPKLKKITGRTSNSSTPFGNIYYKGLVWEFPSATEFTGYIWNATASYPGEIHFAAENQAAIEACDGYDMKWGFTNATIYFDL